MKYFIFIGSMLTLFACAKQAAQGLAVRSISSEIKGISSIEVVSKDILMETSMNYLSLLELSAKDENGASIQRKYCVCIRKQMKLRNMFVTRIDECNADVLDQVKARCRFPNDIDKARAIRLGLPMEKDLYELALRGDAEGIFAILKSGEADVNRRYRWGNDGLYAPLHGAVQNGHAHLITLLLDRGANINVLDNEGNTPLNLPQISDEIAHLLARKGADFNLVNKNGENPFFNWVRMGRAELVRFYFKNLKDVNSVNEFEENLINVLLESYFLGRWQREEFINMVKFMIENGVSPNQRSTSLFRGRDYPIILGVVKNDEELLKLLLRGKLNLNVRSIENRTPLMLSLMNRNQGMTRFLIENGADVNLGDGEELNPLYLAIPDYEMVKFILDKGFKLNYANVHGIIRRAEDMEATEIVTFLKERAESILKEEHQEENKQTNER